MAHIPRGRVITAAFAAFFCILLFLTGCSADTSQPMSAPAANPAANPAALIPDRATDGLFVIAGDHANVPKPSLPAEAAPLVRATILAGQPIGIVALDGDPKLVQPGTVYPVDKVNPSRTEKSLEAAVASLNSSIHSLSAQTPGNDVVAAINLAANAAKAAGRTSATILVLDSLLADTGSLNLTPNGMSMVDPAEMAKHIVSSGGIADLKGLHFLLVGAGYGTGAQKSLSNNQMENIRNIVTATLTAAGASTATVVSIAMTGDASQSQLPVTPVPVIPPKPYDLPLSQDGKLQGSIVFDSASSIRFVGGTADFVDLDAASKQLYNIAEWLNAEKKVRRIMISGTISSGGIPDSTDSDHLSLRRAQAVFEILRQTGVSDSQMEVEGLGYTASPPDIIDGRYDLTAAAANRTIRIKQLP